MQADTDPTTKPIKGRASAHIWVCSTYFGEGFPYSIVNNLGEILFKEMGASLQAVGMTALFHLPWNLKFLWGPLVDQFETKRRWLLASEVLLTIVLIALAFVVTGPQMLGIISGAFAVLAVLSATHDIAIDGFYLEGLDERGQSKFVGYRAMAYKVASLLVRGPLIILIGWAGWSFGFGVAAAIMLLLSLLHWLVLPKVEKRKRPIVSLLSGLLRARLLAFGAVIAVIIVAHRFYGILTPVFRLAGTVRKYVSGSTAGGIISRISVAGWIAFGFLFVLLIALLFIKPLKRRVSGEDSYYARAFVDFLARPRVGIVLAFVVLFRTGESFLQKMKWPFLRDVMGMSMESYGAVNGTLGVIASFAGTLIGGWLIARHGLKRWIWPFVLAQNVLNLLYALASYVAPQEGLGLVSLTLLITSEHFGEGLGTAVFMVYLMRCCDPAHKAAHMAILTALMSISFTVAGVASGFLAVWMGFTVYFVFTFVATVPAMLLIPWIPNKR